MKKKRILCGLLTLAMLMALLTVTAFAEDAALTLPPEGGELASGTYQLSEDLTISNPLEIPKNSDITIDLNGHTLNTPAANWGVLVYGTCTIVDSAGNGTIESGEHAFRISKGGELRINGGTTNASGTANCERCRRCPHNFKCKGILIIQFGPSKPRHCDHSGRGIVQ